MGEWSKPLMLWVSSGINTLLVQDKVTLYICFGIFVFFLFNCFYLWIQSRKVLKELTILIRFQEKKTDSIKAIDEYLQDKKKVLSELWSRYKDNWVFPEGRQVQIFKKERFSTVSSTEYFNPQNCIDVRVNMEWFQSLPSILTGLGIFFTFIGLAMALPYLQSISDNARQSFFSSASVAFWSSVIGLACSIFFSWQLRTTKQRLLRKIDSFSNKLDETIPVLTPQRISLISLLNLQSHTTVEDQIYQILNSFSQNALDEISKLVTNITEEFAKAIKKKIDESASIFTDAAKQLDNSLKNADHVAENLAQNLINGSNELSKNIKNATDYTEKCANEINKNLNDYHEKLTSNINETSALMKKNAKDFSKLIEDSIKSMESTLINLQLDMTTTTKNSLAEFKEELKDLSVKFSQSNTQAIGGAISEFEKAVQDIHSEAQKAVSSLSGALVKVKETNDQLCTTMEESTQRQSKEVQIRIDSINKLFTTEEKNIEGKLKAYLTEIAGLTSVLEETRQKFKNMVDEASKTDEKFIKAFETKNRVVLSTMEDLNKSISLASTSLKNSTTDLSKFAVESEKLLSKVIEATKSAAEACKEANKTVSEFKETFDSSSAHFAQTVSNSLDLVDDHLEQALTFLGDSISSWKQAQMK